MIAVLVVLALALAVLAVPGARPALARGDTPGEERYDEIKDDVRRLARTPTLDAQLDCVRLLAQADCEDAAEYVVAMLEAYALEARNRGRGGVGAIFQAFHMNLAIREAAIDSLATFRSPEALEYLLSRKVTRRTWEVRTAVLRAFGRMRTEVEVPNTDETRPALDVDAQAPVLELLTETLEDRHAIVAEAATWALADWADPALSSSVREQLESSVWQIRLAAVRALVGLGLDFTLECDDEYNTIRDGIVVDNLDAIIDALKRETAASRMREEMHLALKELSGKTYTDDPAIWRRWLDAFAQRRETKRARERARREAEERGEDPDDVTVPIPDPVEEPREPTPGEPYFYGVQVGAGRNAFVLDATGSMAWYHLQEDVDKFIEEERRLMGPGRPPYDGDCFLDLAKYELGNTLEELSQESWFTVLFYDSRRGVQYFEHRLVQAIAANKRRGKSFATGATWGGDTNLYDGLIAAYGLREYQDWTGNFVSGPDSIFLFTDGQVNDGTLVATNEILAHMRRVYELRHIRIHTIGIGEFDKALLEGLAKDSGGQHRGFAIRIDRVRESQRAHGPGNG